MSRIVIEKASCNARIVKLCHDNEAGDWYVREPDQDLDDVTSFDTLDAAKAFYDQRVKHWLTVRNWEAQAAYDERWGTDNGFSPWDRREY